MKRLIVPALLTLLIVVAMCYQARTPDVTVAEAPQVELGELAGFTSEVIGLSAVETNTLPRDTRIEKRLYTAGNGHWFLVTAVIGGREKGSIHRPELCLPSQGFLMTRPHTVSVDDVSWRFITLAAGNGRDDLGFAYTFFNQEGFHTSSHVQRIFRDVWDRSFHARIDRWVMVTVLSSRSDDAGRQAFLRQLKGRLR